MSDTIKRIKNQETARRINRLFGEYTVTPDDEPTRKPSGLEIDWMEFFVVVIFVLIGTPIVYSVIIDNVSAWLNSFYF